MEERKEDLQEEMTVENTEETLSDEAANTEAETDNAVNAEEENAEAAAEEAEQAEDTDSEEVQDGPGDKSDKKFFKKKEKKKKKQDALKEKVDELEDKVKRQMAEFDNFRKRTEREKAAMFETGAKSVIEKILPVVDNFERGLASIPEEEKGKGFADGRHRGGASEPPPGTEQDQCKEVRSHGAHCMQGRSYSRPPAVRRRLSHVQMGWQIGSNPKSPPEPPS